MTCTNELDEESHPDSEPFGRFVRRQAWAHDRREAGLLLANVEVSKARSEFVGQPISHHPGGEGGAKQGYRGLRGAARAFA